MRLASCHFALPLASRAPLPFLFLAKGISLLMMNCVPWLSKGAPEARSAGQISVGSLGQCRWGEGWGRVSRTLSPVVVTVVWGAVGPSSSVFATSTWTPRCVLFFYQHILQHTKFGGRGLPQTLALYPSILAITKDVAPPWICWQRANRWPA